MASAAARRNVRDLGPVIELVQARKPERTDLAAGLLHLHDTVCRHATDCRFCHASLSCERLLVKVFTGQWECRE